MAKHCLVCLVLTQILVLQAVSVKSEVIPVQRGGDPNGELAPVAAYHLPKESGESPTQMAESPEIIEVRRLGKHHSSDKSVAGGGVIIGGLVTAIFAAVFCYIRVTRKRGGVY